MESSHVNARDMQGAFKNLLLAVPVQTLFNQTRDLFTGSAGGSPAMSAEREHTP